MKILKLKVYSIPKIYFFVGMLTILSCTNEDVVPEILSSSIENNRANQGKDKYDYFYNNASSYGGAGILNFALRIVLTSRAITPSEMAWTMPVASNGKIWINPALCFADLFAYDQIKHYKKTAIRLCSSSGQLHWTLAYGAKQTGSWLWRNYYFLQIDNGAAVGIPGSKTNGANYTKAQWWNPWLMVWY